MLPKVRIPTYDGRSYRTIELQTVLDNDVPEPVVENLHTVRIYENAIKFAAVDMFYVFAEADNEHFQNGYYDVLEMDADDYNLFNLITGRELVSLYLK